MLEKLINMFYNLDKNSISKIILLIGIFLPLISFFFVSNYNSKLGIVNNIMLGKIEIYRYPINRQGCFEKSLFEENLSCRPINQIKKYIQNEMKVPKDDCELCIYKDFGIVEFSFKYILVLSIFFIFTGLVLNLKNIKNNI
jgi:hypothetical protein